MQSLRANKIHHDDRLLLVVVQSVELLHSKCGALCHLYGRLEPVALVVADTERSYAVDMQAESVDLEPLREQVPGLDAMLAAFARA